VEQEHPVAACSVDVVAVDVIVDVAGPLQDQIAVHAAVDLVFLQEDGGTSTHVHSVAEGGCHLVQEYVGVAVGLHLYAHFLVQLQHVVADV